MSGGACDRSLAAAQRAHAPEADAHLRVLDQSEQACLDRAIPTAPASGDPGALVVTTDGRLVHDASVAPVAASAIRVGNGRGTVLAAPCCRSSACPWAAWPASMPGSWDAPG